VDVYDSGCSRHMTNDLSRFKSPPTACEPRTFKAANGKQFQATRKGPIDLPLGHGDS
ncbi:hypothetical protein K525DRAFT_182588, partial [Schizophyllum commune Loenen D]